MLLLKTLADINACVDFALKCALACTGSSGDWLVIKQNYAYSEKRNPSVENGSQKTTNNPEIYFSLRQGMQYACKEFTTILNKHSKVKQSLRRKRNCWDNAVAESFFKILKSELVYQFRLQSPLGYITLIEYEVNYYQILNPAYGLKKSSAFYLQFQST